MTLTTFAAKPAEFSSPAASKDYLDHLKKLNDVFYDQVKATDQKAAYIFTFMIALLITSSEGRAAFQWQRYIEGEFPLSLFSAVMAGAATVSLVSAVLVLLPRRARGSTTLFWGAWEQHRAAFLTAAGGGDPNYLFNEYLGNVDNLASIVCRKYRYVKLAFRALVVMVLAYVCLLLTAAR